MKELKKISLVSLAALLVLAVPATGSAALTGKAVEEFAIHVSFEDLDLSKEAGVQALYSRLKSTASRVCGSTALAEAGSIRRVVQNRQCYQDFLSNAVTKIDNERLAEIHRG